MNIPSPLAALKSAFPYLVATPVQLVEHQAKRKHQFKKLHRFVDGSSWPVFLCGIIVAFMAVELAGDAIWGFCRYFGLGF